MFVYIFIAAVIAEWLGCPTSLTVTAAAVAMSVAAWSAVGGRGFLRLGLSALLVYVASQLVQYGLAQDLPQYGLARDLPQSAFRVIAWAPVVCGVLVMLIVMLEIALGAGEAYAGSPNSAAGEPGAPAPRDVTRRLYLVRSQRKDV